MEAQMIQFMPMIVLSLFYVAIVYVIARKRGINPWGWTIGTLVPGVGLVVSAIFFFLTFLSVLDRLNALERTSKVQEFS
ncbi:hypothetical protein [Caulobacter sp. AP07]|uniref:hypothetical protein n=1 Tax=Caulobacter sp. AP07 TaxID=1144304 RepID=UPI0002FA0D27|nr:hypothetical protein [Caulobacter sp. AP07]